MNLKKINAKILPGLVLALFALVAPDWARAFGISPPQVINDKLVPSAHYEQEITLSRAEADEEIICTVEPNTPGFENWLTFDPGKSFTMPKGEKVARLKVSVDVPKDAKPGRNRGTIRVTVAPKEQEIGKINIVLGAQIEVDLSVTSEKISLMEVKQVKIPDLEEKWKILVVSTIENKGNVDIGPDKIVFDVYDSSFKQLIKSFSKNRLGKIKAFQQGDVLSFFKVDLPIGQYWGDVKLYKNGEIAWEEKAIFTVKPKGTLPPQPKEPFLDSLPVDPKWIVAAVFAAIVVAITVVLVNFGRGGSRRKKRSATSRQ